MKWNLRHTKDEKNEKMVRTVCKEIYLDSKCLSHQYIRYYGRRDRAARTGSLRRESKANVEAA